MGSDPHPWWRREGGRLVLILAGRRVPSPVPPVPVGPAMRAIIDAGRQPEAVRIGIALDIRDMYGPEVDESLATTEPTVDQWEAGQLTATELDVRRLATLTGFPPPWFYDEVPESWKGTAIICGGTRGRRCQVVRNVPPLPFTPPPPGMWEQYVDAAVSGQLPLLNADGVVVDESGEVVDFRR